MCYAPFQREALSPSAIGGSIIIGGYCHVNPSCLQGKRGQQTKLLNQVKNKIRLKHYKIRSEQTHVGWIKRFIQFHGLRHPATIGADEVRLGAIGRHSHIRMSYHMRVRYKVSTQSTA